MPIHIRQSMCSWSSHIRTRDRKGRGGGLISDSRGGMSMSKGCAPSDLQQYWTAKQNFHRPLYNWGRGGVASSQTAARLKRRWQAGNGASSSSTSSPREWTLNNRNDGQWEFEVAPPAAGVVVRCPVSSYQAPVNVPLSKIFVSFPPCPASAPSLYTDLCHDGVPEHLLRGSLER